MAQTNPNEVVVTDEPDPWISDFTDKYGLEYLPNRTAEKGSNHDKGIVTDGKGNYYKISDFAREQKDGLDTDQGISGLEGTLYRDARNADSDYSVTNWNTAGDVEGALSVIAGTFDELDDLGAEQVDEEVPYEPSEELAQANALVGNWEQSILDGSFSEAVFGDTEANRESAVANLAAAQTNSLLDSYKLNLQADLRPSIQSLLNAQNVVNGAPMKRSNGRDAQTGFPGIAEATGNDSWVWNS